MAGGKTPTQQPSATEIEQFNIAKQKFERYVNEGVPVQNEYIRRTTGYRVGADGKPALDAGKVLKADGSVRTDAGVVAAQQARNLGGLLGGNPNSGAGRMGNTAVMPQLLATDAGAVTQAKIGQQNNFVKGVEGAIAIGRGIEGDALQGLQGLAGVDAQKAQNTAQNAINDKAANQFLLANLGAAGVGYMVKDAQGTKPGQVDAALKNSWGNFKGYFNGGK